MPGPTPPQLFHQLMYNSSVVSVLLYGAETWPLNVTLERRLNGFDSRALLEDRRDPLDRPRPQRRASSAYQPALRLGPCRPETPVVVWPPKLATTRPSNTSRGGLRPCYVRQAVPSGAPQTRWRDVIVADLRQLGLNITDDKHIVQAQLQWRKLVHFPASMRIE